MIDFGFDVVMGGDDVVVFGCYYYGVVGVVEVVGGFVLF